MNILSHGSIYSLRGVLNVILKCCYLYYKNEKSLSILALPKKSENAPAAITEQTHPENTGAI